MDCLLTWNKEHIFNESMNVSLRRLFAAKWLVFTAVCSPERALERSRIKGGKIKNAPD
jgi:hypothetical protein